MLANWCKNLPDVDSVYFHIVLPVHSPAMNEYLDEVRWCGIRTGLNRFVTCLFNVAGALLSSRNITNHPLRIPLGVLTAVLRMSR